MKKLGLIGGLGPESTVEYYQGIISKYQERVGTKEDLPEFLINSINMYKVFELIDSNQIDGLTDYLTDAVKKLEQIGADYAAISANTPHIVFDRVQERVQIPMISIVEETYQAVQEKGLQKTGLLGTKFTMEHDFFKTPFSENNKTIVVPTADEQSYIHDKIVKELENGIVNEQTKADYIDIINRMIDENNVEGMILGCTELPMILKDDDLDIPLFNTTEIHISKIVEAMFN
ncbi:amino acid racemase [Virgibacillus sp. MSP4-1]|uniref:aspartate/glutamate racemase family protein n=1 Tax=Virgibacillus sp. MSP4-1 TaxID=2700081 RepID=UPI0003A2F0D0|nr:amino acid racemase [Virgibacillus sp. MSP4-1]QHS21828.1 amino acid racemase [Virgibacillus sp. MSP4-1]